MVQFLPFASAAILPAAVLAANYNLQTSVSGSGYLSAFSHQAIADPTHGRVNYVNQNTALAQNLTFANGNTFIIRADHTTTLSASGPGRNSVRLQSNQQFTTHVAVFDIRHMPQGCGTWPALWELGQNWPNGGEVDIVEGVNDHVPNQSTLHTSPGCLMPASTQQTGTWAANNCDASVNNNAGCGVLNNKANNYGPAFNNNGGGWYAIERTSTAIKIYFWARHDSNVPSEVKNGAGSINTSNWGTPVANFPNSQCNLASKFGPNNIVINLTLCGDWAGQSSVFNGDGCSGSCVDFVNNNPSAFTNAYWELGTMHIYQ